MSKVKLAPIHGFEDDIRRLFWATITIGNPLKFALTCTKEYENLGLAWYLSGGGNHSVVATIDENIVGYCLVCSDPKSFEKLQRKLLVRLVVACLVALTTGRMNSESRKFYWFRLRDSVEIARTRKKLPPNIQLHTHINVKNEFQNGSVSLHLRNHVDGVCRRLGVTAYFGEMNAVGAKRRVSLRRVGGTIVSDSPNHTFSWLTSKELHRLTLVRTVEQLENIPEKKVA